jgi:serine/threonine protein phosphatase PrpC
VPVAVAPCTLSLEHRIRACYPERVSGDQVLIAQQASLWLLGVVDGCGHGPQAHAVASAVVEGLEERFVQLTAAGPDNPDTGTSPLPAQAWLEDLLRTAHARACGSRGAAIGLSLVDGQRRELWFSGIGNTRILQFRPRGWTGVSRDGQIGDRFPTPIVQCFPLHTSDTVVQFSDGLRESQVRQLRQTTDPTLPVAALADLLMSQALRTDDASVLVLRCQN